MNCSDLNNRESFVPCKIYAWGMRFLQWSKVNETYTWQYSYDTSIVRYTCFIHVCYRIQTDTYNTYFLSP
jgi:hypothetical protein